MANRAHAMTDVNHHDVIEQHNMTTLVERLKRDGLVTAERDNRDKRFVNVTLTDKGREVVSQATPVARDIVNQVMSSICEGDAALTEKLLRVLRQNAPDRPTGIDFARGMMMSQLKRPEIHGDSCASRLKAR
jgi:DNA-binding MarR family transcriptional regulator